MVDPIPGAEHVGRAEFARRFCALFVWAIVVWLVLTWSIQAEQLVAGALVAAATAAALAPSGRVARPWRLLDPRVFARALWLLLTSLVAVVRANVGLARRIWSPSLPLSSGMVIVPTATRTDAELAGLGLISSLVVDNQIVDLDRDRHELQFHAVQVRRGVAAKVAAINGPTERRICRLTRLTRLRGRR